MRPNLALPILFLLAGCAAHTQEAGSCAITGKLFYETERGAHFKGSLPRYFMKALQDDLPKSEVSFRLHLLIDSTGKVCLRSLEKDDPSCSSASLRASIEKMPDWMPAMADHENVNFQANLLLHFINGKLELTYSNEYRSPQPSASGKNDSSWTVWNTQNSNLSNNSVMRTVMDKKGIIWCATSNSIIRIDHEKWQIFDAENTPILGGSEKRILIFDIDVDKDNDLWVLSLGEAFRYDGQHWTNYNDRNSPLPLAPKINTDREGISFCLSDGLIRFDGITWTSFTSNNSPLPPGWVKGTYLDKNGTLWVAAQKGLFKLSNGKWSPFEGLKFPDQRLSCVTGDKYGNIWVGLQTQEVYYLVKIDPAGNTTPFPILANFRSVSADPYTGNLWLATSDAGLLLFDGQKFTKFNASNSPLPDNIMDVLIDRDDNKWIATAKNGLFFTNKR